MVDKNEENRESGQDEYQYTDPESTETYAEPEQLEEPAPYVARSADDKRKRIIIVLVILGLIFVVFQFVKAKNKINKIAETAPSASIEKQMVEQPTAQVVAGASATLQPAMNAAGLTASEQSALNAAPPPPDAITKLTDQSEQNTTQIQRLQTSMGELQKSINQLTDSLNALQTKVQVVISKQGHASSTQKKVLRSHKERAYKIGMREKANVYHIKAVVPRRVWLQNSDGEEVTVKEGDNIPGYGKVRSIDANDGTVVTSSNKIIRFSADDN